MLQSGDSDILTASSAQILKAEAPADSSTGAELSYWTPGHPKVEISASDRQILEIHAEQLVEEVFNSEIEPILLEKTALHSPRYPSQPSWPARSSGRSLPALKPAPPLEEGLETFSDYLSNGVLEPLEPSIRLLPDGLDPASQQLQSLQQQRWQDSVLLGAGAAAVFLVCVGGFILPRAGQPGGLQFSNSQANVSAALEQDQFLDYLQQSLRRLNSSVSTPVAGALTMVPTSTVATVAQGLTPPLPVTHPPVVNSTLSPSPAQSVAVAPVVGLPAIPREITTTSVSLPQIPIATLPPPPPMGEQPTLLPPSPPPNAGGNLDTAPPSLSVASVGSLPGRALPSPVNSAIAAPKSTAQVPNHLPRTLTGVMDMGDQSLALIEISGVTRRIRIGEAMTADGATLVEVSNQEAVVQRGADRYAIQVGQQF